jgi:serine-type D-Ala-D-Ala carboxypeptidase/endopeptidase (penicillin-binding protein 4)
MNTFSYKRRAFFITILVVGCVALLPLQAAADALTAALKNGGAYVERDDKKVLYAHQAQNLFIPASTIKVATAASVLAAFGPDYRFTTTFYKTYDGCLAIRGSGDPSLTSNELRTIAVEIAPRLKRIACIQIDNTFFNLSQSLDGKSATTNPYDASNSAFLVNFNTVAINKVGPSAILSGERETPLTATAKQRGKSLPRGNHRVNFGSSVEEASRHGAEILAHFLKEQGLTVSALVRFAPVTPDLIELYTHRSKSSVASIVRSMLDHSTNVTANQLFLMLGAHTHSAPATAEKGKAALNSFLRRTVGWKQSQVVEGSGLSRNTRTTPKEMVDLLDWFDKYRNLLPREGRFQAKTGTLKGVNTLVGYFALDSGRIARFAVLINSDVPYGYKFKVAESLYQKVRRM